MYDFDREIDRRGTGSIKWDSQEEYGQKDGLLPFWIADTDFASAPGILEAVRERLNHPIIGYSNPKPGEYKAVQGWWDRRHHWKPDTEWMLLSYGVVTGIFFTLNVVVPEGGRVLVFTPVYDPFFAAVKNSGHTLAECPLICENGYYSIDFDVFEKELEHGVRAVILCNPHNPVGRVWTAGELERVADLCTRYGVWLLSDEIHADFGLTRPYTTMGRFRQIHHRLVVYTAISKTFNMAGLGSSCMIIPNRELRQKICAEYEARWMFGPGDLAYAAIEAAYTHGDRWVDEQIRYLRENAVLVKELVAEHMPGVLLTDHEGTFLMWLDMTCLGMCSDEITEILARDYGVALGNGSHYGSQADGFMRLNIGCTRANLKKGLVQMAAMYDRYKKQM